MKKSVRIGIDVGGTFTDVVIMDHQEQTLLGQLKVPTSHHATEGVARGIISAIQQALHTWEIEPDQVIFIAHSTTQATNALLEGDVASVGVVGIGHGSGQFKSRWDTRIPSMELAPGRVFAPKHHFVSSSSDPTLLSQLKQWRQEGVDVIVSSEAFGVDRPEEEERVSRIAREEGFYTTEGHAVSSLYGLRTRTRTAVINGAILPKMIHTATMTEQCVLQAGIQAPLMIMRSDGGVMSVKEVHQRPIMTMLSGPAAGIAGALMHERISDGIFIEVGGTSADISVIRDGQPQTKLARVAGYRTFVHTLDVRTLAIAGGSMVRAKAGEILDVGTRSAHIAGLPYACFQPEGTFQGARVIQIQPTPQDPSDYMALETPSGDRYALTPTCAANALGIIPEDAFAKGNPQTALDALRPLGELVGLTPEETAQRILDISCQKVVKQLQELIQEYGLDPKTVEIIGGGGGAASLIFHTGTLLQVPARLARNAEVISTIGVALAMVRDQIERHLVDPTPEDILQIRQDAAEAVIQIGAVPETVEVQIEMDTRRNMVKATAFGTTELKKEGPEKSVLTEEESRLLAARSLRLLPDQIELAAQTDYWRVWSATPIPTTWWRRWLTPQTHWRVLDQHGVVRLQRSQSVVQQTTQSHCIQDLEGILAQFTGFGDAGRQLPDIQVLYQKRILHLSGLAELDQVVALAKTELELLDSRTPMIIMATPK